MLLFSHQHTPEAFGIVAVEAMASGLALISSGVVVQAKFLKTAQTDFNLKLAMRKRWQNK